MTDRHKKTACFGRDLASPHSAATNRRSKTLRDAESCVNGDRDKTHGKPESTFRIIADYWNLHARNRGLLADGAKITEHDVAMMMADMKRARIATNAGHMDSYVDNCGYLACASELAEIKGD